MAEATTGAWPSGDPSTLANDTPDHHDSGEKLQQGMSGVSMAVDQSETAEEEEDDARKNAIFEVESLCMRCHADGTTRILLLRIPHFRHVILESFECPECGHKDNSVKSGEQIQAKGTKFTLKITQATDLQRQIIRSDSAIFKVDDLGIEMPTGVGQITTVEGMLSGIRSDLAMEQEHRKEMSPVLYERLNVLIEALTNLLEGSGFPCKISIDDPAGNSWIAYSSEDTSRLYYRQDYIRTPEQNAALGIAAPEDAPKEAADSAAAKETDEAKETGDAADTATSTATAVDPLADVDIVKGQIYELPSNCPACSRPCTINSQLLDIPHFKEVVVMATVCEHCGYKSNEVKAGGAIPDKGKRITLKVRSNIDLSRDLLKSQTCAVECPELSLEVHPGTMGGRFTTVEGLLSQVRDDLRGKIFGVGDEDLAPGDSLTWSEKAQWDDFFGKLDAAIKADMEFTLILEDPLASSYVQSLGDEKAATEKKAGDETEGESDDPQLKVEEYERTEQEQEELGLKDMKTEDYEDDGEHYDDAGEAS